MKISIITILNTANYGSVLQSFATLKFWQALECEVEFIDYWRADQIYETRRSNIKQRKDISLKKKLIEPLRVSMIKHSIKKQQGVFRDFVTENIPLTKECYFSPDDIKNNLPEADIYCPGSDQMWNSIWNNGIVPSFFLEYAPSNKKKISFATSIGMDRFSTKDEEAIPLLRKYDLITLREESAVNLLEEYHISSLMVPDPTLLFDSIFWQQYITPRAEKKPYLFVYQLHTSHKNIDFNDAVYEIARKKRLKIIRFTYTGTETRRGQKAYLPKVFELLSLVNYANHIVTDSFHITAFSINFNKPFSAIYPEKFSTRIDNILKITNLMHRRYTNGNTNEHIFKVIKFDEANQILEKKRKETYDTFRNFLSLGKGTKDDT
ncbi:MAG: polysaccharide pyruvyl transferase family protein [Suipraeoptans sp.]